MTKIDLIIAVKNVNTIAKWYEKIFGFKNSSLGGHGFVVLKSETNENGPYSFYSSRHAAIAYK